MPWLRHRLRDADVWAKFDGNAALIKDAEGRVEIVYKPAAGARVYRAGARNLSPAPDSAPVDFEPVDFEPRAEAARTTDGASPRPAAGRSSQRTAEAPANAIHVWTDGACSGNPGPAGLGVVVVGD